MPSNTSYDPPNTNYFDKTKLHKDARGVTDTVTAGATKDIDITISDDILVLDSVLMFDGAAKGDKWTMQVIHPVAGVVFQPVTDWYVDWTSVVQRIPRANFPAKVFAGLKLRVKYTSVGANDVWVCVNLDADKVLE